MVLSRYPRGIVPFEYLWARPHKRARSNSKLKGDKVKTIGEGGGEKKKENSWRELKLVKKIDEEGGEINERGEETE